MYNEVHKILAQHGIALMPLKGIWLQVCVYRSAGTRSITDVDILVRESDYERAQHVLIAAGFRANEIPDKPRVNSIYTHNLKDLLNLADLKGPLEDDMNENSELRESWATISKWSEHARYQVWTSDAAAIMLEAVGAADKGLLPWLQKR